MNSSLENLTGFLSFGCSVDSKVRVRESRQRVSSRKCPLGALCVVSEPMEGTKYTGANPKREAGAKEHTPSCGLLF